LPPRRSTKGAFRLEERTFQEAPVGIKGACCIPGEKGEKVLERKKKRHMSVCGKRGGTGGKKKKKKTPECVELKKKKKKNNTVVGARENQKGVREPPRNKGGALGQNGILGPE